MFKIDFPQQTIPEHRPFRFSNLAFKQRFLYSNSIILAGPRHAAESFLSGPVNRRDVVRDQFQSALLKQQKVDTLYYFGMYGI